MKTSVLPARRIVSVNMYRELKQGDHFFKVDHVRKSVAMSNAQSILSQTCWLWFVSEAEQPAPKASDLIPKVLHSAHASCPRQFRASSVEF